MIDHIAKIASAVLGGPTVVELSHGGGLLLNGSIRLTRADYQAGDDHLRAVLSALVRPASVKVVQPLVKKGK
jgi:hypothetical protein